MRAAAAWLHGLEDPIPPYDLATTVRMRPRREDARTTTRRLQRGDVTIRHRLPVTTVERNWPLSAMYASTCRTLVHVTPSSAGISPIAKPLSETALHGAHVCLPYVGGERAAAERSEVRLLGRRSRAHQCGLVLADSAMMRELAEDCLMV